MSKFKFLNDALKQVTSNTVLEKINELSDEYKKYLDDYYNPSSDAYILFNMEEFAEIFLAGPQDFPKLYHYTSIGALEGILDSKKLYIKSIHEMNDANEMKYTMDLAINEFKKYTVSDETLNTFIETMSVPPQDVYIMSFTANDHSQSLQHYGELALEMDNQKLQNLIAEKGAHGKENLSEFEDGDFYVFPLREEYDQNLQLYMIDLVIEYWLVANNLYYVDNKFMWQLIQNCGMIMFLMSVAFKSPLLSQEEEIRYVLINRHPGNEIHSETMFRENHVMEVPLKNDVLEKVIYSHDVAKEQPNIRKLLDNKGFKNVKDEITKLPY